MLIFRALICKFFPRLISTTVNVEHLTLQCITFPDIIMIFLPI